MSNDFFDVAIESNYGYTSKDSIFDVLYQKTVNFQLFFQNGLENGLIFEEDLDLIAKEMENTAKRFAAAQGLGPGGTSLLSWGEAPKNKFGTTTGAPSLLGFVASKGNTGNLYSHIKAVRENEKITLINDAQNSRGQYYAGHIEFGFRDRGGNMVPARPFMRPALYAVADASKGQFSGTLKRYLEQVWALETLQFGGINRSRGRIRSFYEHALNTSHKGYGRKVAGQLPKGRLKEMRSLDARNKQTVHRNMKDSFSRKVGSRMGYRTGQKDQRGHEHLSTTQWYRGQNKQGKSSKQTSSRQTGKSSSEENILYSGKNQNYNGQSPSYTRQSYADYLGASSGRVDKNVGSKAGHGKGIGSKSGKRYGSYRK